GSSNTSHATKIGTSTGYGEATSQGTATAWAAGGALPAQSGKGWLWDVTTLEGATIPTGNYTPSVRFSTSIGTITADIICRYSKRSSGGTYTLIGTITLTGQAFSTTTTEYNLVAASLSSMAFSTGDKLYWDIFLNITANSSGSAAANVNVSMASSASQGTAQIQTVTPGYATTGTSTAQRTIAAKAALQATLTRSIAATAALQATLTRSVPATAALQSTVTRSVAATAVLQGTSTNSVPATAALLATVTRSVTATTALQSILTRSIPSTAALKSTLTRAILARVALGFTGTRGVPASAALLATSNRGVPSSAALQATLARAIPSTAALLTTGTRSIVAVASLYLPQSPIPSPAGATYALTLPTATSATGSVPGAPFQGTTAIIQPRGTTTTR
nr:hypothetical protein [Ktedonobacterales bacterium]